MQETIIKVDIPEEKSKSYNIYINNESFSDLKNKLDEETKDRKRLIVFSQKVYKLFGKTLGFSKNEIYIQKDGEDKKNIKSFNKIIQKAIQLNLTRKDYIIAIGGGVVGDMAGFAAASYMRGINYIQVPTTLLACVDSSVGGKTAIDTKNGKNYIGAFWQPNSVYINLNFLKTLDEKQYKSGFGEVIKYAFIEKTCNCPQEYNLLEILKTNPNKYLERNQEFLSEIINICLNLKSSVVKQDEKESGLRKILNLGHTFGHALEEGTNYKKYTHGYAVILGLMYAFNMSLKNNICSKEYYNEAFTLLNIYGYEAKTPWFLNKKKIINLMQSDKKADKEEITFILPSKVGEVTEYKIPKTTKLDFCIKYIND